LQAEQELRRAEQRQAAIIQSLPMVLYLEPFEAPQRAPTYISGDLEAICGFTLEHVKAEPEIWANRLHPDDRNRVIAALEARRKTGRSSIEYRWRCADGSYKHFLDQAVLLRDVDGKPVEFAGTLTDISEQRSLESQLVQAQKMDAIGKLTGGIAHDFNNLLAAVIGGLSLLEKRATLAEEQKRVLGMTKRAAEQGSELVRRLLAFARRQRLQPHPIELASLKEAVSDLLTHTLGGLVNFEWRVAKGIWTVFADQAQLELALVNLIINARDAMPAGGTVTIVAENQQVTNDELPGLAPGDYVRIGVADTGTGISPEHLEKVMEPFFTTKEVGKGSGLGLSMVYGFAKQSDGAFRLESELGRGTSAQLWLPRAPETAIKEVLAAPEPQHHKLRALKVLLVDDHAEVRSTTAAVLEDGGHEVFQAGNGAEALTILKKRDCDFDVLITDYAMPHLSGTDFLREARLLCPDVPALLITGYADTEMIHDRPAGVEMLLKPFTPVKLDCAIARACGAGAVAS
jgi:PAS domain S-box-containing protein